MNAPEPLSPLHNGAAGRRGCLTVQVQPAGVEPGEPGGPAGDILDFVASDATLDRYEEVISPDGWRLENYRRNPVFQNAHQYGDIIFTLGRALVTEVRLREGERVLYQKIEFATAVNPMARIAHGLYRGGFLSAVSVGFVPLKWEEGTAASAYRRRYLEQELLEVSAVGIPANPNALLLGLRAGAVERGDLRELLQLLQTTVKDPASSSGNARREAVEFAAVLKRILRG